MKLQSFYPDLKTSALSFEKKPQGFLGSWQQTAAAFAGSAARYASPFLDTKQKEAVAPFAAIPSGISHNIALVQVLGDPLRKQEIPAGFWTVSFGARLANASATYTWAPKAALYIVNGITGERRATIFNPTVLGAASRTSTDERTAYNNQIQGASATLFGGDYLALELGISVANAGIPQTPLASMFTNGSTPIIMDNVSTTDAQAVLVAPQPLLLSLPQSGESTQPTVTLAQAVALLKEHFPPGSDKLYDWDDSSTTITHVITFLAECIKVYGYDTVDRLMREVSPLTCVELIPDWEGLLGITYTLVAQSELDLSKRRDAILARLRESGGTTLFNIASVVVALAKYIPPNLPEILELSASDLRQKNQFSETLPDAVSSIPDGTGFDNTSNLVRKTPVLLDGGHLWNTGVLLQVELSTNQTAGLRFQITGPDYNTIPWEGGPSSLTQQLWLRSPLLAGGPVHGIWQLNVYKMVGSPAVKLKSWSLCALGAGFGGRSQAKWNWSVYLDPMHQGGDRRAIYGFLSRVTQAYARSFLIYSKTSLPGTPTHRVGQFIPGA